MRKQMKTKIIPIIDKNQPTIGVIEWFRPGEYEHVEDVLSDMKTLGIQELRTEISWADWFTTHGIEWYDWLLPRLAGEVNLLPCVTYTPPSISLAGRSSSPPKNPKDYADFIDVLITRYGQHFEWIELWNEPNNINDWDWRLDPSWRIFSEMIGGAAYWAQHRGKKTVLAGMSPTDPYWLELMCRRNVLQYINAVGIHGFPGTWEHDWNDWSVPISKVSSVLQQYQVTPELWITEAGYSTWKYDEHQQIKEFVRALNTDVQRVYWYAAYDLHPALPHQDGFHKDERHYHFGMKHSCGKPKLLFREWAARGVNNLKELSEIDNIQPKKIVQKKKSSITSLFQAGTDRRHIVITGGAGFIGSNLASRLLANGERVLIYDNLSQPGSDRNLQWLKESFEGELQIRIADIRDSYALGEALYHSKQVYHLAAQTSVDISASAPYEDYQINAGGTLGLLECLRSLSQPPTLVYTSTSKVYGPLSEIELVRELTRYIPQNQQIRRHGIDESFSLNYFSPFASSKGTSDQYVLQYARTYSLPAVVLRLGTVYGPHQLVQGEQGWVTQFIQRAFNQEPIILNGDGMQVRDLLYVDDLIDALILAQSNITRMSGEAFNIGGGQSNTLSLLEFIQMIESLHGEKPYIRLTDWRIGDQKYYVSNNRKLEQLIDWSPTVKVQDGISALYEWHVQELAERSADYVIQEEAIR